MLQARSMGDHRKTIPVNIQKRLTKFFVSNLPDRCSGNDIAGVVRVHAEIYDIYVARKRDKMGNRFGFVSLLDVKNTGDMEKTLSNIRMGEFKLNFNVARFTLEDGEINNRHTEMGRPKAPTSDGGNAPIRKEAAWNVFTGQTSFKDVCVGKKDDTKEEKVIVLPNEFHAHDHVLGKAVTVRLVDFKSLKVVGDVVNEMITGGGVVQYMGGMCVIVSFHSGKEAEQFIILAKEKRDFFSSVGMWVGQSLPFERIAWLRIQGIPLHLLDNEVINRIGEYFGKVIQVGQHDCWDSDLSYDYIGVLIDDGKRVQEEIILQWKGRKYRVWVAEDVGDWEPDFLMKTRMEEPVPTHRSSSSPANSPVNSKLTMNKEGADLVEGDKEGCIFCQNNSKSNILSNSGRDVNDIPIGTNIRMDNPFLMMLT
ncbi:putative RNA-binding domain superfamily [Helianthus annuus]|nr:putative RNA-binding domain superfamily [Helianthus annuus]